MTLDLAEGEDDRRAAFRTGDRWTSTGTEVSEFRDVRSTIVDDDPFKTDTLARDHDVVATSKCRPTCDTMKRGSPGARDVK
jgi:hypothetical protein